MRKNDLLILARHLRPPSAAAQTEFSHQPSLPLSHPPLGGSICPKCERMLYGEFLPEENR